jgi:phosphatidylinositol 3-kinase
VPTLLALWNKNAPIDVADALKLLSKEKCFEHSFVREYAVSILRSASDDELLTFLLQLVQALRYEPSPTVSAQAVPVVDFALESSMIGINHLDINAQISSEATPKEDPTSPLGAPAPTLPARNAGSLSPLANFLIDRACSSPTVANYFYWYLKVETEDEQSGLLFQTVFDNYIVQLSTSGAEGKMLYLRLSALDEYIAKISGCQRDAREQGRRKEAKEQSLIKLLDERGLSTIPKGVDWVPMPLDPSIQLMGLIPSTASMFASAVYPCVIEFIDYNDHKLVAAAAASASQTGKAAAPRKTLTHKIMFKSGDDLRQDQLIMQMISLMDRLLKKVNLDLKLLTYGILAVGQKDGKCDSCCYYL